MNKVFADTLYWVALVRPGDPWRDLAERARRALGPCLLVTTDEVLGEFMACLAAGGPIVREKAAATVHTILANPNVKVIAQSRDTFLHAVDLYSKRADKRRGGISRVRCADST